jgi:hypothetical protein
MINKYNHETSAVAEASIFTISYDETRWRNRQEDTEKGFYVINK